MHELATVNKRQVRIPITAMRSQSVYFENHPQSLQPAGVAKEWAYTEFPKETGWAYHTWSTVEIPKEIITENEICFGVCATIQYVRLLEETTADIAIFGRRIETVRAFSGVGSIETVRTAMAEQIEHAYPREEGNYSFIKISLLPHNYNRGLAVDEHKIHTDTRAILRDIECDPGGVVVRLPMHIRNRRR